jgi:hypothetical protein
MKRSAVFAVVIVIMFLAAIIISGCTGLQPLDGSKTEQQRIEEIAKLEQELAKNVSKTKPANTTKVEEVTMPSPKSSSNKTSAAPKTATPSPAAVNTTKPASVTPTPKPTATTPEPAPVAKAPSAPITQPVTVDDKEAIVKVKENEQIKIKAKVSDPDNDSVTYAFNPPLNKQGEWKTKYGDAGEYYTKIIASDGKLTTEKRIKLVVERVNVAPMIEELKDVTIKEGETFSFAPKVTDPNKDQVQVTVSEPLKNGKFITDHTNAGEYPITVTATDGELKTEKKFKLIVKDVNVKPEVTNLKDITVNEGERVKIEPMVTDKDNDKYVVTISEPVGNDGIWQTDYTSHGKYTITVTVDDGKDQVVKDLRLTVNDINMPPEIVDITLYK